MCINYFVLVLCSTAFIEHLHHDNINLHGWGSSRCKVGRYDSDARWDIIALQVFFMHWKSIRWTYLGIDTSRDV